VKEYGYTVDLPHSTAKVWAIMQDYPKWPEFAKPMVTGIHVESRGDAMGNGLVRHVNYKLPLGFKGKSIETVDQVEPCVGYRYRTLKGTEGRLRLEKLDDHNTRLHFDEKLKLNFPFSMFEGLIRKFMEDYNKKTMLNMSKWLSDHPSYPRTNVG
jgi:hypothetical protein